MTFEDVGVVVIGRNEGDRLVNCLSSLNSQSACVVYVDSGSTDGSREAAERLGAHAISLNADRPFTAARARNEGFGALKGLKPDIQLVQFVDGDCQLDKNWLDTAAAFLRQRGDVAIVCGRRRERYPLTSIYNRLCDVEWNTPIGEAATCGGDSLVRAGAFETVGGFQPQLIAGEEPELCVRLRERGWKIWRLDADMTYHDAGMSRFAQWWLRAVRFGYAMTEVSRLHWNSRYAIWKSELRRAIVWGGLLPTLILLACFVYPWALATTLIYPLQIFRIAIFRGALSTDSWAYATFMTLGRFAEVQGMFVFFWRRMRNRSIQLIEYK